MEGDSQNCQDYLKSFNVVGRKLGRCRIPKRWSGAAVSLISCNVQDRLLFQTMCGRPKTQVEEEDTMAWVSVASLDVSGHDLKLASFGSKYYPREGLTRLVLGYCNLDLVDIIGLFSHMPTTLQALDLSGNFVGDEGIETICKHHGKYVQQLYDIILADTGIGDASVEALSTILATSTNIEYLSLSRNRLGNLSCFAIANKMILGSRYNFSDEQDTVPLEVLDLSWNQIDAMNALAELLFALEHKPKFRCLTFHGNEDLFADALLDDDITPGLEMIEKLDLKTRQRIQAMAFERDMPIPCRFGCNATDVTRRTEEAHRLERCAKRPMTCEYCDEILPYEDLDGHHTLECLKYPHKCVHSCGTTFKRNTETGIELKLTHEQSHCDQRPVTCKLKCGMVVIAQDIEKHYSDSCEERGVQCEADDNCKVFIRPREMEGHVAEHRRLYQAKLINSEAAIRDRIGDENPFARKMFTAINQMRDHVIISKKERDERRKAKELQVQEEALALKNMFKQLYRSSRAEKFQKGQAATKLWYEMVPRSCHNKGCKETILDKFYEQHQNECEFQLALCIAGCGEKVLRKEMDKHVKSTCVERTVYCNRGDCTNYKMRAKDQDQHDRKNHAP